MSTLVSQLLPFLVSRVVKFHAADTPWLSGFRFSTTLWLTLGGRWKMWEHRRRGGRRLRVWRCLSMRRWVCTGDRFAFADELSDCVHSADHGGIVASAGESECFAGCTSNRGIGDRG